MMMMMMIMMTMMMMATDDNLSLPWKEECEDPKPSTPPIWQAWQKNTTLNLLVLMMMMMMDGNRR